MEVTTLSSTKAVLRIRGHLDHNSDCKEAVANLAPAVQVASVDSNTASSSAASSSAPTPAANGDVESDVTEPDPVLEAGPSSGLPEVQDEPLVCAAAVHALNRV